MKTDPIIDEVRSVRRKISDAYGHDIHKMITDHMKQQERYAGRLVTLEQLKGRRKSPKRAVKRPAALAN